MYSTHDLLDKEKLYPTPTRGVHKVKYQPDDDWDFHLAVPSHPTDLELVLPHYRARYQPVDDRLSMFIANDSAPIKAKVCRHYHGSKFYLEIRASTSDVTVWLPSDFKGQIHHTGRASFTAGFTNRILRNARINGADHCELPDEDDVVVRTRGHITFRMWDIQTHAPENTQKEALKRIFSCVRRAPETTIDWDFLLED